jgi:glyoxylase-like metal-dependent hydrolase (beta-lactamase superfamily II)
MAVTCEGYAPISLDEELPGDDVDWEAERMAHPWAFHDAHSWAWHVHSFALFTRYGTVMVDTGLGAFPPYRPWAESASREEALAAAGVDATSVRAVAHTHLHADHAGGAVVEGVPTFPNAVHHVHPADWSFFERPEHADGYTARRELAALEREDRLDLTEDDHDVVPGVRLVHSPGHTPGHRAIVLEAGGETLLFTGDLLHLPVQVARPDARSSHDEDADLGCRSRVRLLSEARAGGWRVAVSHFARPLGRVTDAGWSAPDDDGSADRRD